MDKAWEEVFFAEPRWKDMLESEKIEHSPDDVDWYAQSREQEVEMLKQAFLRAILIMGYGIFEKGFICFARRAHFLAEDCYPPRKPGNVSALSYFREVLENTCVFSASFKIPEWDKADRIRQIRNVLAHDAALLEDQHALGKFSEWKEGFFGVSHRPFGGEESMIVQVWMEPFFVRYAFNAFSVVLRKLMDEFGESVDARS